MTKNTEEKLRAAMEALIPSPVVSTDPVIAEAPGFGMTVLGFNQVTLNGIITRLEYRGPDSRDGFVPHLKVWVAVPALVPVVFKGSPIEPFIKNPDVPAATLGVPGITHMQRVPVIISGRAAATAWGAMLAKDHMVWISGQLVPLLPFEPGDKGLGILATQVQVSSRPIVWDTRRQGNNPWSETYTDAFYAQLANRKIGAKPKFSKFKGSKRTQANLRRKKLTTAAQEDADKQYRMSVDDPPWEKG